MRAHKGMCSQGVASLTYAQIVGVCSNGYIGNNRGTAGDVLSFFGRGEIETCAYYLDYPPDAGTEGRRGV